MTSKRQDYKIPIPILIIFFILSVYIIVMGYLYYSNEKKEIKANAQKELTAIAELKVREINGWRNERIEDAKTILNNPLFADFVSQFMYGHVSTDRRTTIYF